jgi:hypothetical protein
MGKYGKNKYQRTTYVTHCCRRHRDRDREMPGPLRHGNRRHPCHRPHHRQCHHHHHCTNPPHCHCHHGQLGLSLVFPPFDVWGDILVSSKALHVGSTDRNRYCPLFPDFPPWTPQSAASTPSDPPLPILSEMLRMLRLASALTGSQVADQEGASGIQRRVPQRGAGRVLRGPRRP